MAIYRNIQTSFWNDAFIVERTPDEKLFYLYLMTNPKTSMCGIYEFSIPIACLETGFTKQKIESLLSKFQNDYKRIVYSQSTGEIAILNWLKYNDSNSPKIAIAIETAFTKVKNQQLVAIMRGENTVSIQYPYGMDTISHARVTDTVPDTASNSSSVSVVETKDEIQILFENYANGDTEIMEALTDFKTMRKGIKEVLSLRAAEIMLKQLDKLSQDNRQMKIDILHQSILNNWRGIFAVKSQNTMAPRRETSEEEIARRAAEIERGYR